MFGSSGVEEPEYRVIFKEKENEIRQYPALLVAKTIMAGDMDDNSNKSFRKIADFIFGNNSLNTKVAMTAPVIQEPESQKIAMTAPVIQEPGEKSSTMYFVMPKEYTRESLPQPNDPDIIIEELPARTIAVYSYSGLTDEKKLKSHAKNLEAWLDSHGYRVLSGPRSARYDPPWTLPFLRRNEVHIDVTKK